MNSIAKSSLTAQIYLMLILIMLSCGERNATLPDSTESVEASESIQPLFNDDSDISVDASSAYTPPKVLRSDLIFIKELIGQYAFKNGLLDNEVLKLRLIDLLGERYTFVKDNMEVQSPIEIMDNIGVIRGMKAHSGGDPSAFILIDFTKNILYAGIRDNEKEILYAEGGSSLPDQILRWADER